jgi:hypothetical protein
MLKVHFGKQPCRKDIKRPKKFHILVVLYALFLLPGIGLNSEIGAQTENLKVIFSGNVTGIIFNDSNQNGHKDLDEPGVPGVTIVLKRFSFLGFAYKDVGTVETDAEGSYKFAVNKRGIYLVEELDPLEYTSTTPNEAKFFLGFNQNEKTINFGDFFIAAPLPESTVAINADPTSVQPGESSLLNWTTENAETVSINQGIGVVPLEGSLEVTPEQTTTFTILARGRGGEAQSSITVTLTAEPPPPQPTREIPTVSIEAIPSSIRRDQTSILKWTATHVTLATIDQGIGKVHPNGALEVVPNHSTIYTIEVAGPGGKANDKILVTVIASDTGGGSGGSRSPDKRPSKPDPSTLSSPTVTGVDAHSAILGATIETGGGAAITGRGTLWNTSGPPISENDLDAEGAQVGVFSHSLFSRLCSECCRNRLFS